MLTRGNPLVTCRADLPSIPSPKLARFFGEALQSLERELEPVVGAQSSGPCAEDLVCLAAEIGPALNLAVLVEARGQNNVELFAGIDDAPRLHRRVPLVLPTQLVAELAHATVDDDAVFGEA